MSIIPILAPILIETPEFNIGRVRHHIQDSHPSPQVTTGTFSLGGTVEAIPVAIRRIPIHSMTIEKVYYIEISPSSSDRFIIRILYQFFILERNRLLTCHFYVPSRH